MKKCYRRWDERCDGTPCVYDNNNYAPVECSDVSVGRADKSGSGGTAGSQGRKRILLGGTKGRGRGVAWVGGFIQPACYTFLFSALTSSHIRAALGSHGRRRIPDLHSRNRSAAAAANTRAAIDFPVVVDVTEWENIVIIIVTDTGHV